MNTDVHLLGNYKTSVYSCGTGHEPIKCKGLPFAETTLDALKNSEADMVKLEISGPLSPMKVVPMEGDSFLFLVLPMKLKTE